MLEQLAYLRLPVFRTFESEEGFEKARGQQQDIWAVYRGAKETTLLRALEKVADSRRAGIVKFSTILAEGQSSLTLYRPFGESLEFQGEMNEIKYFLDLNMVPEVCEFNREKKGYGPKFNIPRLVISCQDEEEKEEARSMLESLKE